MSVHEHVLQTNKPDKEIEFFWLNFKDSILKFLRDEDRREIVELSEKLNILQREERYDMIVEYIDNHIEKIGYDMISRDDHYNANILSTNIKRWDKITSKKIGDRFHIFDSVLKSYLIYKSKKNKEYDDIILLITDFSKTRDLNKIDDIINFAIKNKMDGIIDRMKDIIDIRKFLTTEDIDYKRMRGNKLIRYMKAIE